MEPLHPHFVLREAFLQQELARAIPALHLDIGLGFTGKVCNDFLADDDDEQTSVFLDKLRLVPLEIPIFAF
ncbi:MAG: hypothetical protein QF719_02200 [Chloroflexota bacterium]|jgi:hypothetical protein|nr:hypothetical protein [Chloroflexota bacterium]MDP6757016.1 hypothetical protein [Chloroflexota bacterium]|tara:strand:- start:71 stop:283 length:213 start_codon:yes stop_codon:yes gene_type:complete